MSFKTLIYCLLGCLAASLYGGQEKKAPEPIAMNTAVYHPRYCSTIGHEVPKVTLAADFQVSDDEAEEETDSTSAVVLATKANSAEDEAKRTLAEATIAVAEAKAARAKADTLQTAAKVYDVGDDADCTCGPDCPCRVGYRTIATGYGGSSGSYGTRTVTYSYPATTYTTTSYGGSSGSTGAYETYGGGTVVKTSSGRYRNARTYAFDGTGWHLGKFVGTIRANVSGRVSARRANRCASCY